eukprot:2400866-Rhodomonas_salina.1
MGYVEQFDLLSLRGEAVCREEWSICDCGGTYGAFKSGCLGMVMMEFANLSGHNVGRKSADVVPHYPVWHPK